MNENIINNLKKFDFHYEGIIGSGGFGEVYKVRHDISDQYYAVKTLKQNRQDNPENILREIKAIAAFNHPNIISYRHSFVADDELYLVMEYCSAGSLSDLLKQKKTLKIEEAVDVFLQLTEALSFIHKKGYIHQDIKPANILFTSDNAIKLSDFGTVNTSISTIVYAAPEMFSYNAPIDDARTDVFSLGMSFMECIIGYLPFVGMKRELRSISIQKADFPIQELPYWLQQLLLKACHYNPAMRFQNMEEFSHALQKRFIPQLLSFEVLDNYHSTQTLKTHILFKRWAKANKHIENHSNDSIGFLLQKGKYYIGTHQIQHAKNIFETVLKRDIKAPIEKELAEMYLQHNEPSKAASLLQSYILHHFKNIEAHNQMLHSYFLSDQWEIGLYQCTYLFAEFKEENLFDNNTVLFEILGESDIKTYSPSSENNPFAYYNLEFIRNNPSTYSMEILKKKLLFQEYKFRNITKKKNSLRIVIDDVDYISKKSIVSFGRKGINDNDVAPYSDNNISRHHFVIINQKNDVWLYDMSMLGLQIDGMPVKGKAFLLGRHIIKLGTKEIIIISDSSKFI